MNPIMNNYAANPN